MGGFREKEGSRRGLSEGDVDMKVWEIQFVRGNVPGSVSKMLLTGFEISAVSLAQPNILRRYDACLRFQQGI